jgi:hypothetical protein
MTADAPRFDIRTDLADGVVYLTLAGFWSADDMGRFEAEMALAMTKVEATRRPWACFTDARTAAVQAQDILARHIALFERYKFVWQGRVAVLAPSALFKLQAGRVVEGDGMAFFDDQAAAVAWLKERQHQAKRTTPAVARPD